MFEASKHASVGVSETKGLRSQTLSFVITESYPINLHNKVTSVASTLGGLWLRDSYISLCGVGQKLALVCTPSA